MPARRLLVVYALVMAVLGLMFYGLPPPWSDLVWLLIGLTGSAAVLVGIRVNRPERRAPWVLLSLATLAFIIGDTSYAVLVALDPEGNPFPAFPEIIYQVYYVLLLVALVRLPHADRVYRDRSALLDALTVTFGFGLLVWVFVVDPYVHLTELSPLSRAASVAPAVWDVLILAIGTRLVTTVRRSWTARLLFAGLLGLLVSDVLYALSQLSADWRVGGPIDLGWFALYALTGAAALHPSMVTLTQRETIWQREVSWPRIVALSLTTLIAPAVLLVQSLNGDVNNGVVIALASAALFLLVVGRLAQVVHAHRRSLARERSLREAGAALVGAASVADVREAVQQTIARLVGSPDDCRVLLTANESDGLIAPARMSDHGRAEAPDRLSRVVAVSTLDPAQAGALAPFDTVLLRPLAVADPVSGSTSAMIGELAVAADRHVLPALRPSVDALGFQASLALERIALDLEIDRRNSEEYFRSLVGNSADVIVILGDDGRIRNASPTASDLFGRDVVGLSLLALVHPDDRPRARTVIEWVTREASGDEWRMLDAAGHSVHVEVSCRDLRHDRAIHGLVVTLRDVTARRGLERELSHRASHDPLTGLANRGSFRKLLDDSIGRPAHGRVVGALQIDLDDFKVINDTLGHDVGDRLLVAVAHRLTDTLGEHDLAARVGADEFAALVTQGEDPADIEHVAERVVDMFAEPFDAGGSLVRVSASVGVATTVDASDAEDLLRHADLALLVAKAEGKSQWRGYQQQQQEAMLEQLELHRELAEALQDDQLFLMLQPIVELRTGGTTGFEALVRWRHPTRGMISPDRFIAVAEERGLIMPLGMWVLRQALAAAVRLRRSTHDHYVSVNVSPRQFRTEGFAGLVLAALREHEFPASGLVLEITEGLFLDDDDQVRTDLADLRRAGVGIAIDDFGTGYSSLAYLHRVPVDTIKIDRSFIDGLAKDPQRRKLVGGILGLARSLGLDTVAEGVETEPDRDLLIELGCRLGQGYLYAKPLDEAGAAAWLAEHAAAPASVETATATEPRPPRR